MIMEEKISFESIYLVQSKYLVNPNDINFNIIIKSNI